LAQSHAHAPYEFTTDLEAFDLAELLTKVAVVEAGGGRRQQPGHLLTQGRRPAAR